MPPRRFRPIQNPVTIRVEGDTIVGERGEPVAVSLLAAGRLIQSRSLKYHRPRSASCMRARCDGCLMRVNGAPSAMTCVTPADDGMRVEEQNVIGSAQNDLLGIADWFFPDGMDHHHMFTQWKPINEVMQKVARRAAGIGRLPDTRAPVPNVERTQVQVLVIGGGLSGMLTAIEASRAGLDVLLIEEFSQLGGTRLFAADPSSTSDLQRHADLVQNGGSCRVLVESVVLGVYEDGIAIHARDRLLVVQARAVVVAAGGYEVLPVVPNNDLPGIWPVTAAEVLLHYGVLPGERIALFGTHARTKTLANRLRDAGARIFGPFSDPIAAFKGDKGVEGVVSESSPACDAAVVEGTFSASYELAVQAGGATHLSDGGFRVRTKTAGGRIAERAAWAVGSCTGAHERAALAEQTRECIREIGRQT